MKTLPNIKNINELEVEKRKDGSVDLLYKTGKPSAMGGEMKLRVLSFHAEDFEELESGETTKEELIEDVILFEGNVKNKELQEDIYNLILKA